MSNSSTSAAATSSCVESGFEAQSTTSAPPSLSVRIRFAVSLVTWRQAETRYPTSGCSAAKRSRIAASTGICRSAHSIRLRPSGASPRSLTSCRFVVATRGSLVRGLRFGAPVPVLEPHDVLELRRRDLGDRRVLDCRQAMDGSGREVESGAGRDDLVVQQPLTRRAELELRAPFEHVPRLVLLLVELEAERLPGPDEQDLAGEGVGLRPDQLMAPRLLHLLRLEGELFEPTEVGRGQVVTLGHEPREPTTLRLRTRAPRPLRVLREVLLRDTEVLGRVDRQPDPLVAQGVQPALRCQLGERRRLVVALLGQPLERLVTEDVDAATHPLVEPRRFPKAGPAVVVEVDHAEGRAQRHDGDRRRRLALVVQRQQLREVDVDELVAVQREQLAGLPTGLRGEADPSPAPERLRLGDPDHLPPHPPPRRPAPRPPPRAPPPPPPPPPCRPVRRAAAAARRPALPAGARARRPPADLDERL